MMNEKLAVFHSSFITHHSSFSMIGLQPSTFEEFERETARGNVVPVVRTVLADLQTPVGAFLRVAGDSRHAFLLESVEGGERIARSEAVLEVYQRFIAAFEAKN